jgi:hypothetical protein
MHPGQLAVNERMAVLLVDRETGRCRADVREEHRRHDLPRQEAEVLIAPRRPDRPELARLVVPLEVVPADPEPVAVDRDRHLLRPDRLPLDQRVLRPIEQIIGENRLSDVCEVTAHIHSIQNSK